MKPYRDLGWIDTAGLAFLALGALACIVAYGVARAVAWCWRKLADGETAMGLAAGIVAGFVVGVICWDLVGWLEIWLEGA